MRSDGVCCFTILYVLLRFTIVRHFNVCPRSWGRGDGDCVRVNAARNVQVPTSSLLPAKIAAVLAFPLPLAVPPWDSSPNHHQII